jgi:hypothetical protein
MTLAMIALALAHAGCLENKTQTRPDGVKTAATTPAKPGVPVAQLVSNWSREVQLGTNPVNNTPMPAIVGRVYLFDKQLKPVDSDGSLTVELYDDTNRRIGKPSQKLEEWVLHQEQLEKLKSKDPLIGTGYSLALPWPSFKPEVTQIHMVVHYTPRSGQALTLADQVMTLQQSTQAILSRQAPAETHVNVTALPIKN